MSAHLLGATGDNIVYGPTVAGQYPGAEAVNVLGSVAAEYIRQLDPEPGTMRIGVSLSRGFKEGDRGI
jgi:hypothetical protein